MSERDNVLATWEGFVQFVERGLVVLRVLLYTAIGAVLLAAAVLLSGCAVSPETIEVQVPVPVRAAPPPELLAHPEAPLPVFVSPAHPEASSALTPAGERALQSFLLELATRLAAWEAWATAPLTPTEALP